MKALVLGAGGTLGRALVDELPARGYQVEALPRAACDVGDPSSVDRAFANHRPQVVFNAAAFTDVDGAESRADQSFAANAIGPENLARACERTGAALVHYSTDFVFDGELERPYDEFDPPSPQGVYARSKLAGERLVAAACAKAFVVRVGCLYGRGGKNFPSTILRRLRSGETVKADESRKGSPTWVVPVARLSAELARTEHFGLYHATAQGETTWADYARFLAAELALPPERVQALPTSALTLIAPRPRRAILDNRMLRLRGLDTLADWQAQARGFMAAEG